MENKVQRHKTRYTKDVLPSRVTRHLKENSFDSDAVLKEQVKIVKDLEVSLFQVQRKIAKEIGKLLDENRSRECTLYGEDFLKDLLEKIISDEKRFRNAVLGEQEAVEMFKEAVDEEKVSPSYLEAARMQRDDKTADLFDIVFCREMVFAALEAVYQLGASKLEPSTEVDGVMTSPKFRMEYLLKRDSLEQEHGKLKRLTEWQKNPELMRKEIKKLGKMSSASVPNLSTTN